MSQYSLFDSLADSLQQVAAEADNSFANILEFSDEWRVLLYKRLGETPVFLEVACACEKQLFAIPQQPGL